MIWHYFPIGMRFPVQDFTDETKKECWETAVSSLLAAGGSGALLYEAQENYDFGSGGPVYTCIACFEDIKQSRTTAKNLYTLETLMTELCMLNPFVQANYLESYGPYPILGRLVDSGVSEITEIGTSFLPAAIKPMERNTGLRMLIASEPLHEEITAERLMQRIGRKAAKLGYSVRRLSLPSGEDSLRAIVTAAQGRFEFISTTDPEGARVADTIGILPGSEAVIGDGHPIKPVVCKTLDLGYRKLIITGRNGKTADTLRSEDSRFEQCTVSYLFDSDSKPTAVRDSLPDRIGFETTAKQADFIVLFISKLSEDAEAYLTRLTNQQKPTCLITADSSTDKARLMREFPILRDVIICPETDSPYIPVLTRAFESNIPKMTGKSVAKTNRI